MREWLESKDFYELCQQYRHAKDGDTVLLSASEAFVLLKSAILGASTRQEGREQEATRIEDTEAWKAGRKSAEGDLEFWSRTGTPKGMTAKEVKNELADYHFLLENVPAVYMAITGGKLSYPNYYSQTVITEYEDDLNRICDEAVQDAKEEFPKYEEIGYLLMNEYGFLSCHVPDHKMRLKVGQTPIYTMLPAPQPAVCGPHGCLLPCEYCAPSPQAQSKSE